MALPCRWGMGRAQGTACRVCQATTTVPAPRPVPTGPPSSQEAQLTGAGTHLLLPRALSFGELGGRPGLSSPLGGRRTPLLRDGRVRVSRVRIERAEALGGRGLVVVRLHGPDGMPADRRLGSGGSGCRCPVGGGVRRGLAGRVGGLFPAGRARFQVGQEHRVSLLLSCSIGQDGGGGGRGIVPGGLWGRGHGSQEPHVPPGEGGRL